MKSHLLKNSKILRIGVKTVVNKKVSIESVISSCFCQQFNLITDLIYRRHLTKTMQFQQAGIKNKTTK